MNNLIKYYCLIAKYAFHYTKNLFLPFKIIFFAFLGFLWRYSKGFDKIYKKLSSYSWKYIYDTPFWKYACYNMHDFRMMDPNYEPQIQSLIKKISKALPSGEDIYFINIWSNIGRYSIDLAKNYGYRVLAFEPAPETYEHLKNNIVLSKLEDFITTYNFALWNSNDILSFEFLPWSNWGSYIKWCGSEQWHEIFVPVKKFDELWISESIIKKTKLIIMDVEWFEYNVLQWMQFSLDQFTNVNIIMEISQTRNKKHKDTIFSFMEAKWYSYEQIDRDDRLFYK